VLEILIIAAAAFLSAGGNKTITWSGQLERCGCKPRAIQYGWKLKWIAPVRGFSSYARYR